MFLEKGLVKLSQKGAMDSIAPLPPLRPMGTSSLFLSSLVPSLRITLLLTLPTPARSLSPSPASPVLPRSLALPLFLPSALPSLPPPIPPPNPKYSQKRSCNVKL